MLLSWSDYDELAEIQMRMQCGVYLLKLPETAAEQTDEGLDSRIGTSACEYITNEMASQVQYMRQILDRIRANDPS